MKLIYIYGLPAVGKLTVAKELSKITNFKLFHAHLTADYVSSLFPVRDNKSDKLKWHFAFKMFNEAAKNNIDIIFTKTYETSDNLFLKTLINTIEKHHGKILFVKLLCKPEILYERVTKTSRKSFGKIKTVKKLKEINNNFETIPFKKSLIIDNSNLSAKKVAEMIKEDYKL